MTTTSNGVDEILADPEDERTVTLIVTIADTDTETTKTAITNAGGDIEEEVPYNCLAVTINEEHLEALVAIDGVEAVEIEGTFTGDANNDTGYTGYAGYPASRAVTVNSTAEEIFNLDS